MISSLSNFNAKLNNLYKNQAVEKVAKLQKNIQISSKEKKNSKITPYNPYNPKMKTYVKFEALFVDMMLKEMEKTVPKNSIFGSSQAQSIMKDMLYDKWSFSMAQKMNLGLGKEIYEQEMEQKS